MCRLGATMFSEFHEQSGGHGQSARMLHLWHLCVIYSYMCALLVCVSVISVLVQLRSHNLNREVHTNGTPVIREEGFGFIVHIKFILSILLGKFVAATKYNSISCVNITVCILQQ